MTHEVIRYEEYSSVDGSSKFEQKVYKQTFLTHRPVTQCPAGANKLNT